MQVRIEKINYIHYIKVSLWNLFFPKDSLSNFWVFSVSVTRDCFDLVFQNNNISSTVTWGYEPDLSCCNKASWCGCLLLAHVSKQSQNSFLIDNLAVASLHRQLRASLCRGCVNFHPGEIEEWGPQFPRAV